MSGTKKAVAVGLFDGVHIGHRAVIECAVKMAQNGLVPAVFTFESASVRIKQGRAIRYIYPDCRKSELLRSVGVREIVSADFSRVKDLSGEEFVKNILADEMNAGYVVCGHDLRFGKNASCGTEQLAVLCRKYGIILEIAGDVTVGGENVSSRRIRDMLSDGNVRSAALLLGSPYSIRAEVVTGNRIGRTIGLPTINQNFTEGQLVPRYGAYATVTLVDGKEYPSVTNIGVKPTVSGERTPLAETHIIGFGGDVYGQVLEVRFRDFLRPERKFASLDELKARIASDIAEALRQMT